MKILKYKKISRGRYKLTTDTSELVLYEDVILKYDLLIKKEVDLDLIDKIIEEEVENYIMEEIICGNSSISVREFSGEW